MTDNLQVGSWRGFVLSLSFDRFEKAYIMTLQGELKHYVTLGTDIYGNLQRMNNTLEKMPEVRDNLQMKLEETKKQLANAAKGSAEAVYVRGRTAHEKRAFRYTKRSFEHGREND